MVAPLPVTATSRSVALRLEPDAVLQAGSLLNLTTSPEASATARTVQGTDPTAALATARGIGAGYSHYYSGLADEAFFQSPNLSIHSGGGSISGDALATAFSTGRGDTAATAQATNIGLANVSYLDRYGGALRIGTSAAPFTAKAVAGSSSILDAIAGSTATLQAKAVVRGLEGSGTASTSPIRSGTSLTPADLTAIRREGPLAAPLSFGPNGEPLLDLTAGGGLVSADLLLFRDSAAPATISFYRVLDADGTVRAADGRLLRPGDTGYSTAALAPSNRVSELSDLQFDGPNGLQTQPDRLIDESGLLAPFYTYPASADQPVVARFAYAAANPDGKTPFLTFRDGGSGLTPTAAQIGAAQVAPANAAPLFRNTDSASPILDLRSSAGLLSATVTVSRQDSLPTSQVGFYRIVDERGGVRTADGRILYPSNPAYRTAALAASNRVTELAGLARPTDGASSASVLIDEQGLLAPFARLVFPTGRTNTYFTFNEANPNRLDHLILSPDGQSLWLENQNLAGRRANPAEVDFDDLRIQFTDPRAIALPLFDFSSADRALFTDLDLPPAANGDTIGFYRLVDTSGAVRAADGTLVRPGDAGYRTAALAPANLVSSLDGDGLQLVDERGLVAPFLRLAQADASGIRERFPFPSANPGGGTPFTVDGLNRFSTASQRVVVDVLKRLPTIAFGNGAQLVAFEDVQAVGLPLLDLRNSDGPYRTELQLLPLAGTSPTSVGFYRVLDHDGSVRRFDGVVLRPGDAGYAEAALAPANRVPELADLPIAANASARPIPVEIDEQAILAPFATVATANGGTTTLFPWVSANPAGQLFPVRLPVGTIAAVAATAPNPERSFYGQPNAVVRADAELTGHAPGTRLDGTVSADAVGLDGYTVKAVPFGNGDGGASIGGTAIATLQPGLATLADGDRLSMDGRAIGVANSHLYGAPTLNTTVEGVGLALARSIPAAASLNQLQGIGILNSRIDTNQGNDVIRAFGGMSDRGMPIPAGLSPTSRDAAGFDGVSITTGLGDDTVFGRVLHEVDAGIDHDGDGQLEDTVFLDRAALSDPARSGFDGIRHTAINTGIGNDLIGGSSSVSHVNAEIGDDTINLDRARYSSFWGGIGNDALSSKGPALHNVFWGGLGNDNLSLSSGDGNLLDGGLGQDVLSGGTGVDHFVVSDAAGALRAASSTSLRDDLADAPLWSLLSQQQKDSLWQNGTLLNADGQVVGRADAIRNFEAGAGGDVLHLSDSLAAITQELWQQKGAIFGVGSNGTLTVNEASADGTNKVGIVVGSLADIQKLGIGSPTLAYATDTRQLMFDADGLWASGAQSLGSLSISNGAALSRSNLQFGSASGAAAGAAPTGQQGVV